MQTVPSDQVKTGYSGVRVKKTTKELLEQIMRETNAKTEDDIISLLIDHYDKTTKQPKP
jgi:hypothetical protein